MLDKTFVDALVKLGQDATAVQQFVIGGRDYTDKQLVAQMRPQPTTIELETLQGLTDFIAAKAMAAGYGEKGYLLHVRDFKTVVLISAGHDEWSRRTIAAKSECPNPVRFAFDKFLSQEAFIIGLLANFVPTAERDTLIRFVSNIAASQVNTATDDGISQEVHTKKGVVLKSADGEKAPGRVKLAPYRTFREVEQPESEFVFRLQSPEREGGYPTCALFEADGGAWKISAVENVARWLRVNQGEGADELPVVA